MPDFDGAALNRVANTAALPPQNVPTQQYYKPKEHDPNAVSPLVRPDIGIILTCMSYNSNNTFLIWLQRLDNMQELNGQFYIPYTTCAEKLCPTADRSSTRIGIRLHFLCL